jgi:hypothetical protein
MLMAFASNAQNSGYLGKHLIISTSLHFKPTLASLYGTWDKGKIGLANPYVTLRNPLNIRLGVTADAVVGKRTQIGISLDYFKTGMFQNKNIDPELISLSGTTNAVHNYIFGANLTRFTRNNGGIAPVGIYTRMGFIYARSNYTDSLYGQLKTSSVYAVLGTGKQMVKKERWLIDVGTQMCLNTRSPEVFSKQKIYNPVDAMRVRASGLMIFSLYFKVGYLVY